MSPSVPTHVLTIAIDGPAGAGKSTIARLLARRLAIPYLDTGAMYRAVGLIALREGIELPLTEHTSLQAAEIAGSDRVRLVSVDATNRVLVDGQDVTDEIRTQECAMMASAVSAVPEVRHELVKLQRRIAAIAGGVVEGRDIGTVVLPAADLKVFLTASADERARRRTEDLQATDKGVTVDDVRRQQAERDRQDTRRAASPLQVAPGAIVVDSTGVAPEAIVERLASELERRLDVALDRHGMDTVRSRNHGS